MNVSLTLRDTRHTLIVTGLAMLLVATGLISLTIGAVSVPLTDVLTILLHKIGVASHWQIDSTSELVLTTIRLPRIFMTILVGAALGVSGGALQGLFRNPLVEPGLIGVSGGSAAGVVLLIVFGSTLFLSTDTILYNAVIPVVAFAGGALATLLVLGLGKQSGKTNIAVLVLTGVAVNALAGAIIGLSVFYANENQLRTFTFWTLGDLGGATADKLIIAAPLLIGSIVVLLLQSRALNAIALGEAEAYHMGVNVERTKRIIVFFSALAVGVSVSLAGIIGFIGLVIPHLVRVLFNSDHRLVLPASVLGGAWLLLVADIIARTLVAPAELPIGVMTSLIGAPFFIALLMKAKLKNHV
ncbi:MAG: iron ABC transporter permease [Cyclobacteriaceae bacterium]